MSAEREHEPASFGACPLPSLAYDRVLLGHGSGGTLSAELMRDIFLPAFYRFWIAWTTRRWSRSTAPGWPSPPIRSW